MFCYRIFLQETEKGDVATMECYYAHLSPEMIELTDKSDPPIQLVSARHCPCHEVPCVKGKSKDTCCLGKDKQCTMKCPNNR